jgi:hypothetical protein
MAVLFSTMRISWVKTGFNVAKKLRRDVPGWFGRVDGVHKGAEEFEWKINKQYRCAANFGR